MRPVFTFLFCLFTTTIFAQNDSLNVIEHSIARQMPFKPGEKLEMKATVGFIKAAEVNLDVSEIIYTVNNMPTYKMSLLKPQAYLTLSHQYAIIGVAITIRHNLFHNNSIDISKKGDLEKTRFSTSTMKKIL